MPVPQSKGTEVQPKTVEDLPKTVENQPKTADFPPETVEVPPKTDPIKAEPKTTSSTTSEAAKHLNLTLDVVFGALLLLLPFAVVAIGTLNVHKCSANSAVPLVLIFYGLTLGVLLVVRLLDALRSSDCCQDKDVCKVLRKACSQRTQEWPGAVKLSAGIVAKSLVVALVVLSSVAYKVAEFDNVNSERYCSKGLLLFAFVVCVFDLVLTVLFFLNMCFKCRIRCPDGEV